MSLDITALAIKVTSEGITKTTEELNKLSVAANKVEAGTGSTAKALKSLEASQKASSDAVAKLLAQMQKQSDLLGANTSQTNAYSLSLKNATELEKTMGNMLGAEVDAYKRLAQAQTEAYKQKEIMQQRDIEMQKMSAAAFASAQTEAIRINKSLDTSRAKSAADYARQQTEAIAMNKAFDASIKSGALLEQVKQMRDFSFAAKQYAAAQAEAITMNKAFDAALKQSALKQQTQQIRDFNLSAKAYSDAHAEAIRMNNSLDKAVRDAAKGVSTSNEAMREAHALARGLSGSLGALWLTYGNFAGMAAGLAIGASLKGIVSVGKDVEATLEAIRVRGEETIESVGKMRAAILSLGTGIFGPQEVAKAFDVLILAGLRAEQVLVAVRDVINLSLVGGTSLTKSSEVLVQVGTALGYTAEGYSRIADVIAKTAAVSMASVESLSEAFKSGSVVGKLYGVSLVDIGTQLAALSNLGIRGSAAGTALKNAYKELSSDAKKVQDSFKAIGLSAVSLKDAQGNFLGVIEVVKQLSDALDKMTPAAQKQVVANLSNERGMKDLVEILSLYRKKIIETGEATTQLEQNNKRINESWGYAAQGAAAMALTVDAQFKSVKNSFEVTLVKVFQDIQPQLSLVARQLKEAFSSSEFTSGLQSLALGVANLTVFIVENGSAIMQAVKALIAFKAAAIVFGVLTGAAEGFMALAAAMRAASFSAAALQVSLGLIGLALIAGTALLFQWMSAKDEASQSKVAMNYMDDFKGKLDEENKRLADQIEMMKNGKKAADAYADSQRNLQMQMVKQQGLSMIGEANENRGNILKGLTDHQKDAARAYFDGGTAPAKSDLAAIDGINKMIAATKRLEQAKLDVKKAEDAAQASVDKNIQLSKQVAEIADKQSKDSMAVTGGSGTLPGKTDQAAINAAYTNQITKISEELDRAKRTYTNFEKDVQSQVKSGTMTELESISVLSIAHQDMYEKEMVAYKDMLNVKAPKNSTQPAEIARARVAAEEKAAEEVNRIRENEAVHFARLDQQNFDTNQKRLEAEGAHAEAAAARKDKLYSKSIADQEKDLNRLSALMASGFAGDDSAKIADQINKITLNLNGMKDASAALVQEGKFKDLEGVFNNLNAQMSNVFKSVKAATEEGDLSAMWTLAIEAQQKYIDNLPKLKAAQKALADSATSPAQKAVAEEDLNKILAQGVKLKTTFNDVGTSIAKSLEAAFGKGGKALGDIIKLSLNYQKQEEHSTAQKMNFYGDLAGAASGFFDVQSEGYKKLQTVSQAFHAYELAATLADNLAKGISAVLNQALGDPYTAFARMAAMAAVVAGLGIAIHAGGGGGSSGPTAASRQAAAGTGSVLGDKDSKSESISKSLTIMEKNSGLGLAQGGQMVSSLKTIANNIGNLSSIILRVTGKYDASAVSGVTEGFKSAVGLPDPLKLFGTTTSITDQGISIATSTLAKIQEAGVIAQKYADVQSKKSFLGISYGGSNSTQTTALGQDVNDQFTNVIKSIATTITESAKLLGVSGDDFTKHLQSFVVDIGSISLKGLSSADQQKELEAVFSKLADDMAMFALGAFKDFQKGGEGFFETLSRLANDLIQVKDVFAVLGKSITGTGLDAVKTSEALITAAGGLEALTTGTKFFVDNFLTEAQRMGPVVASVQARLAELNESNITTIEQYSDLVMAQDLNTSAGQNMYAALIELAPAFKAAADFTSKLTEKTEIQNKQHELELRLMEVTGKELEAMVIRRQDEIDALNKLNPVLGNLQKAIYDAETLDSVKKFFEQRVSDAKANLTTAYQRESSALQQVIDKFKAFSDSLKKFKDSLLTGNLSTLSPEQKYIQSKLKFETTSALAKGGNATAIADLQNVSQEFLDASRGYNASTEAYARDFDLVQKGLADGAAAADVQVSVAQSQLTIMQAQYNSLLGIQAGVLSFKDALAAYTGAVVSGTPGGGNPGGATNSQVGPTGTAFFGASEIEATLKAVQAAAGLPVTGLYFTQQQVADGIDGSHANGLDYVPKDNYRANLHKGERVQTAKAANASDENSAKLVALTKELLARICKVEENTAATVNQRGAIAENDGVQMDKLISKVDELKRKVAAA